MSERDPNADPFDFDHGGDVERRVADFVRLRTAGDGGLLMSFEEHLEFSELVDAGYYAPLERWQRPLPRAADLPE